MCANSERSEPSLVAYVISTKISWAGSDEKKLIKFHFHFHEEWTGKIGSVENSRAFAKKTATSRLKSGLCHFNKNAAKILTIHFSDSFCATPGDDI